MIRLSADARESDERHAERRSHTISSVPALEAVPSSRRVGLASSISEVVLARIVRSIARWKAGFIMVAS